MFPPRIDPMPVGGERCCEIHTGEDTDAAPFDERSPSSFRHTPYRSQNIGLRKRPHHGKGGEDSSLSHPLP